MPSDPLSIGLAIGFGLGIVAFARWRRGLLRSYLATHPDGRFRLLRAWVVSSAPLWALLAVLLGIVWLR
jgi:hypothetical protein